MDLSRSHNSLLRYKYCSKRDRIFIGIHYWLNILIVQIGILGRNYSYS
jgi:hypothetical protein